MIPVDSTFVLMLSLPLLACAVGFILFSVGEAIVRAIRQ